MAIADDCRVDLIRKKYMDENRYSEKTESKSEKCYGTSSLISVTNKINVKQLFNILEGGLNFILFTCFSISFIIT